MTAPPLLTFPARPIQGGRLDLAPPKRGLWFAEPKLNGWRALIHTPTGTMWNRHGTLLTIADCFQPTLALLAKLASRGIVWADCDALERRHNLGRGTLVVLDVVPESGTPSYEQRRAMLESLLPTDAVFSGDTSRPVPSGAVVLTPTLRADSHADALAYYQRLREANRVLGCDFFEGVVMKRADSIYPAQMRSANEECRGWVKHRSPFLSIRTRAFAFDCHTLKGNTSARRNRRPILHFRCTDRSAISTNKREIQPPSSWGLQCQ